MKIAARSLSGGILDVEIDGPVFKKVARRKEDVLDLPWIAPGLVDIQVNGFGGVDFNRPVSDEAWEEATRQLYRHGCTGFLLTLITNSEEGYRELLAGLLPRLRSDPRNCLGLHLEGPWLNPDPAFRGAHRAEWMRKPDLAQLEAWQKEIGALLKLITLAPETDPDAARRVIKAGTKHGTQFFIGHSGAMGGTLEAAVAAGAVGWTHLGNAAPAVAPKFPRPAETAGHAHSGRAAPSAARLPGAGAGAGTGRAFAAAADDRCHGRGRGRPRGKIHAGRFGGRSRRRWFRAAAGIRAARRLDPDAFRGRLPGRAHGRDLPRGRVGGLLHAPRRNARPPPRHRQGPSRRFLPPFAGKDALPAGHLPAGKMRLRGPVEPDFNCSQASVAIARAFRV
jgi:hypothetical protein